MENSDKPVAVLIDAESVDAADASSAVAALAAKFGPLILHGFGDFRDGRRADWSKILGRYGGQSLQVTPAEGMSNSIGICIAMNAMDMLHRGTASAICLFCGDSDYSQLASRLRAEELPVIGFGSEKNSAEMSAWFDTWYSLDDEPIDEESDSREEPESTTTEISQPDEPLTGASGDDFDAMAAIEGNGRPDIGGQAGAASEIPARPETIEPVKAEERPRMVPGPEERMAPSIVPEQEQLLRPENQSIPAVSEPQERPEGRRLPDDATLLLSGFISDNIGENGYALLADVADAARSLDILVPPAKKAAPGRYFKQVLADDRRFEIVSLATDNGRPEYIRRI